MKMNKCACGGEPRYRKTTHGHLIRCSKCPVKVVGHNVEKDQLIPWWNDAATMGRGRSRTTLDIGVVTTIPFGGADV